MSANTERSLLRVVIVGHVDHGKSTLVGRLFYETGSLPEGKYESIKAMCEKRGLPFEWAFLMDALQAERDQGITIDTTQIWFKTDKRDYVLIDAPGHKEFLKNMITGAAQSDGALLVIDAKQGMQEQSRRHAYLLHLMGVRQVAVAVNKMDLIDYDEGAFRKIEEEVRAYFRDLGLTPRHIVPVSAREGEFITAASDGSTNSKLGWYGGKAITEVLDDFPLPEAQPHRALRFPVQDVYKFDERRIVAGRIESGQLHVGDSLVFSPSNKQAKVQSIEAWDKGAPIMKVSAGQSVGITLDEQIFVERGELASHTDHMPIESDVFRANIFWLGKEPLVLGKRLKLKLGTMEAWTSVQSIEKVIDTGNLSDSPAKEVVCNQVAKLILSTEKMIAFDQFADLPDTGRFVLVDEYDVAGGGIISMEGYADHRPQKTKATNITHMDHPIALTQRETHNGHRSGVLWLTGLSGAGKSTLALALEQVLFERGYQTYALDGDNIRFGLNSNLGFSPEDRVENIRRVGEIAALFARAGFIAITSFISPYRADRALARKAATNFHEVYVQASVEDCEKRDPKGLYEKARRGEIKDFTGVSAPYEEPLSAELAVDTCTLSVEESVARLVVYIDKHFSL